MSDWWSADFETTSQMNLDVDGRVRVWLWSLVGIQDGEVFHGTRMVDFLKTVKRLKCRRIFFHNLRFDGKFIVDWFMTHGFEYGKDYEVIIDGLGSWYELKWRLDSKHTVRIWDSLKKLPGASVEQIGRFLGFPKLDKPHFDRYYPLDYKPTEDEIQYCIRDSQIIAKAMEHELAEGFKSMTLASDCFRFGRDLCLNGRFYRDFFPQLDNTVDAFCRGGFRGGIAYLKPEYEDMEVNMVKVFDVNSLYPWVMHDCNLPYGPGVYSDDEPCDELYFVRFKASFHVKDKGFPFLQLKNTPRYMNNEFIEYSEGTEELTMTSVDYMNFKRNYRILDEYDHEYISFSGKVGLLAPHVEHWMARKIEYERQGVEFMRYMSKTMMNGFYGKTATRTSRENVVPMFDKETNRVSYSTRVATEVEPIYIPYGAFVTAYARDKLINSCRAVWDDFIYCDTDSIHCFDSEHIPLDIHPTELGRWKDETPDGPYEYARYIKQKTYCLARPGMLDGKPYKEVRKIKAAGLSVDSRKGIPFEEFRYGLELENANLKMYTVPGGAILKGVDWRLEKDDLSCVERFMALTDNGRRLIYDGETEGLL